MFDFLGYSPNRSYFAAFNGYKGFGSFFDNIFSAKKHARVFILKGGPGTGKSTLLKGLIKWASNNGIDSDAIYCSSDPSSLDGTILKKGSKSIAVLDGTAPHTFDPKFPGALDEIINLGDGFDSGMLQAQSDSITKFGEEKARAYEDAYSYLGIAGELKKAIDRKTERLLDSEKLKELTEYLKEKLDGEEASEQHEIFCISSFGRYGYTRIENISTRDKTVIGIKGDGYTEYSVMNSIANYLLREKKLLSLCPSPLDTNKIEAIYTENYLIITNTACDIEIETQKLLKESPDTKSLQKLYGESLELAKKAFENASNLHFKIEDIYREAVNFENNEKFFSKLIKNAEALLN